MSGGGVASGRGDRPKAAGGLLLGVGGSQLEVVERELGLETEPCGFEVRRGGLGFVSRRGDRPSNPAPQVDLVRHVEPEQDVAGGAMPDARYGARVRCQEGTVPGIADGAGAGAGRDRREQRGPIETDQGPGLKQPGLGDPEILVGGGDLLLQSVELGVPEDRPPLTARQVIARLRGLPAIHLLVRGRHGRRRPFVFRADHAAAEEHGDEPGEAGRSSCHGLGAAGARAIRTGVPLMSESEGATMT